MLEEDQNNHFINKKYSLDPSNIPINSTESPSTDSSVFITIPVSVPIHLKNESDSGDVENYSLDTNNGITRLKANYTSSVQYDQIDEVYLNKSLDSISQTADSDQYSPKTEKEIQTNKTLIDIYPKGSILNDSATQYRNESAFLISEELESNLHNTSKRSSDHQWVNFGERESLEDDIDLESKKWIELPSTTTLPSFTTTKGTVEIVNEIMPILPTLSDVEMMMKSNHHTFNPNSTFLISKISSSQRPSLDHSNKETHMASETQHADVTNKKLKETYSIPSHKPRWREKKIRHFSRKEKKTYLNANMPSSAENFDGNQSEKSSIVSSENPLRLGETTTKDHQLISRIRQIYTTDKSEEDTADSSSTKPTDDANTNGRSKMVNVLQSRARMIPDIERKEPAFLYEWSTKGPVSLRRHTTSKSTVKRTTDLTVSRNGTTRTVCSDDPCGKILACLPKNGSFVCLCDDHSEVAPHQPCPIKEVHFTPSAVPMQQGHETLDVPSQGFMVGAVITMSMCIFFLLSLMYWRRKKICQLIRHRNTRKLSKASSESMSKMPSFHTYNFASNPNYYTAPPDQIPLQSLSVQLISKDQITFIGDLGEGCFGRVYKGIFDSKTGNDLGDDDTDNQASTSYVEESDPETEVTDSEPDKKKKKKKKGKIVAVKVLKELVGSEAEADFMREVEIMTSFRHPNILSLIGVVVAETEGTPWMVFEFMPFGDLADVLRCSNQQYNANYVQMKPLSNTELLNICVQVAHGMEYLSQQHFVHRDLACRNCLVGENLTVKISDFGMSRDVYTCDYYMVGGSRMLPVRWMAPESILYGKFTLESDVWSFGVVLWEIYSYGKQPYYGHSNEEAVQLILQGILLRSSESCPPLVRDVMRLCWSTEAQNRLTFPEIVKRLTHAQEVQKEEQILEDLSPHLNYSVLIMHNESPGKLPTDVDDYLLPTNNPTPDEYLTVLANP